MTEILERDSTHLIIDFRTARGWFVQHDCPSMSSLRMPVFTEQASLLDVDECMRRVQGQGNELEQLTVELRRARSRYSRAVAQAIEAIKDRTERKRGNYENE